MQSGRPIVPIVASNQSLLFAPEKGSWLGGTIVVKALPPISTVGKTAADVDDLIAHTYAVMQKALDEVNAEAKRISASTGGAVEKK